jgi:hypothetical protein
VARCKIYEIQGPDPSQTASAVRCHREATAKIAIDSREVPVCKRHRGKEWQAFRKGGWPYAVNLDADPPKKKRRKKD